MKESFVHSRRGLVTPLKSKVGSHGGRSEGKWDSELVEEGLNSLSKGVGQR